MSTTRPLPSETTGTVRLTSGATAQLTCISSRTLRTWAVVRGNCPGFCMVTTLGSALVSTTLSEVGPGCFSEQPASSPTTASASTAQPRQRRITQGWRWLGFFITNSLPLNGGLRTSSGRNHLQRDSELLNRMGPDRNAQGAHGVSRGREEESVRQNCR